jgi:hypothetical protein
VDPVFSDGAPTMLIAGNDKDAKRTVGDVLADFGWSDPVDIGGIEGSRELEAIWRCGSRSAAPGAHGTTVSSCSSASRTSGRHDRLVPRTQRLTPAARPNGQCRAG